MCTRWLGSVPTFSAARIGGHAPHELHSRAGPPPRGAVAYVLARRARWPVVGPRGPAPRRAAARVCAARRQCPPRAIARPSRALSRALWAQITLLPSVPRCPARGSASQHTHRVRPPARPPRLSSSCRRAAARVDANIRNYGAYKNCQATPSTCTSLCAADARAAHLGVARLHRPSSARHLIPTGNARLPIPIRRRKLFSNSIPGDLPTELGRLTALTELCAPQRASCPAPAASARAPADRTTPACSRPPATTRRHRAPTGRMRCRHLATNKFTGAIPTELGQLTTLTDWC